ncbi:hypothetical protein OIDMADRAFT_121991 [Oidiodendron maius Zn]|uniref:Oxidoreductase-like domain-containing protein n=1 Tax=Oidiodendron maius (strain Zn) TaxID=913774 RepID=A0A0C3HGB5_OIDMZ|nr:hypothetical protein OIDMADRAFT_121991 [Oidiodendron maius Zn]
MLSRPPYYLQRQNTSSSAKPSTQQANPIGDYYASLLEAPTPRIKSKPPTTASSLSLPTTTTTTSSAKGSTNDSRPAIIFSSRLSSPLERRSDIQRKSTLVAGVWVPPRPEEPDNCCMSGCVNCVWDQYRDEMEEYVMKRREADYAMKKESSLEGARKKRRREDTGVMNTIDNDGGGSEGLWGKSLDSDLLGEDMFKNIPVGIREFMKQEKRLKEKHAREGTAGA